MRQMAPMGKQRGALLLIVMVLLVVLTVVGVSAMQNSTVEQKMTNAQQDNSKAFEAAELALMEAETYLTNFDYSGLPEPSDDGSTGVWESNAPDESGDEGNNWWRDNSSSWWGTSAEEVASTDHLHGGLARLHDNPSYVIERFEASEGGKSNKGESLGSGGIGIPESYRIYRITTRGVGVNENTEVYLQSTYARLQPN